MGQNNEYREPPTPREIVRILVEEYHGPVVLWFLVSVLVGAVFGPIALVWGKIGTVPILGWLLFKVRRKEGAWEQLLSAALILATIWIGVWAGVEFQRAFSPP